MRLILEAVILLVLLVIAVLEIVGAVVAVSSTCGIGVSTCCTSFSGRGCSASAGASASSRNKCVLHTFIILIIM